MYKIRDAFAEAVSERLNYLHIIGCRALGLWLSNALFCHQMGHNWFGEKLSNRIGPKRNTRQRAIAGHRGGAKNAEGDC